MRRPGFGSPHGRHPASNIEFSHWCQENGCAYMRQQSGCGGGAPPKAARWANAPRSTCPGRSRRRGSRLWRAGSDGRRAPPRPDARSGRPGRRRACKPAGRPSNRPPWVGAARPGTGVGEA
jgi:hypothetical protein